MAIHKLHIDEFDEVDYDLIAIHTSLEDYRLAYFLNQKLPILLSKSKNEIQINIKEGVTFFSRYIFLLTSVQAIPKRLLVKLILISGARYLVFLLQYLLIFTLCSVDISALHIVSLTALLFLILAIIPTLTLAELGIRGKVSLFLFGIYSTNTIGILAAAGGIWFLNLIIPACLGGLILLRLQYFRKQV